MSPRITVEVTSADGRRWSFDLPSQVPRSVGFDSMEAVLSRRSDYLDLDDLDDIRISRTAAS